MNLYNLYTKTAGLVFLAVVGPLTTLTYAIDNPDTPDYIGAFKSREKVFTDNINSPKNTTNHLKKAFWPHIFVGDEI